MKKRKLKNWVVWLLRILFILAFIVAASDGGTMEQFVISHIIAGIVLIGSGYILIKNMEVE